MSAAGPVYLALVHHPVRARDGTTITTSITNLDVHDLARIARTYNLAGYFIVTPIEAQRALVDHILGYWRDGEGAHRVPERAEALSRVSAVASLDEALSQLGAMGEPLVLTTAARSGFPSVSYAEARAQIAALHKERIASIQHDNFRVGDTVRVHYKVVEGDKERVQVFHGQVIRKRRGGVGATFTVRKVSYSVGVERIFPVYSPRIEKIEL